MRHIIANIHSLAQHLKTLASNPAAYKPDQCPHCQLITLWNHGTYPRQSDRLNSLSESLNPIPIPRYYCPNCKKTCSVLPECIPPRRWYLWATQQLVLLLVLSGMSYRQIGRDSPVSHWTVRRWYQRLESQYTNHCFRLKSKVPWPGRHPEFADFWQALLAKIKLSTAMLWLNYFGEFIPWFKNIF